jgi:hypothetical protein
MERERERRQAMHITLDPTATSQKDINRYINSQIRQIVRKIDGCIFGRLDRCVDSWIGAV